MDGDRSPREEGWEEETEEILDRIRNRGDQRIGQYLLNAVNHDMDDGVEMWKGREKMSQREKEQTVLWNMEAPELLEALKELDEEVRNR
jgi:hypothetical protein